MLNDVARSPTRRSRRGDGATTRPGAKEHASASPSRQEPESESKPTPSPLDSPEARPEAKGEPPSRGAPSAGLPLPPDPSRRQESEREEGTVLYAWDFRRWRGDLQGEKAELGPGVAVLETTHLCGTNWAQGGLFVVPARGLIRVTFLVTARTDVIMMVYVRTQKGGRNRQHVWRGVRPGRWAHRTVDMAELSAWGRTDPLPRGGRAHDIVLYIEKGQLGGPRLFVSEIQAVASAGLER